ncbi:MAG: relaxase domain-containing protein [Gloeocapsa sp. UFS-A4-WI-NPMV-4B04]|nr:relaxase domain-containing protein [Gloeocapsa sp. UFS-A4-WI-NPMV-4B04]
MRSISTISSHNQEQEDYYTNDESLGDDEVNYSSSSSSKMTQAIWHGKGASTLGLEGCVQRQDFRQMFYGYQPGTEERIRGERSNKNTKERLAHDLTLSAPKSFSMAMNLGGDVRLFDIHMESVKETLDVVEKMYAQARLQVDGDRSVVNTGNIIAAIIPHHTSREMDMQLHSHCVIMNGTHCRDGKWRSLWHESIVDAEWLGSYYRQLLAQKVQQLGYEISETDLEKGHSFEIKGYTKEQIAEFSKRSRQIVENLQKRGLEVNAENRDGAVLTTRKTKRIDETLAELQTRWRKEAAVMAIDNPTLQHPSVEPLGQGSAKQELQSAIRHLSERSVSFSREDIYQYVFDHIQTFGIKELNWAIARHKELLPLGKRFTTVEAIERETKTVKGWMSGQGKTNPIMSEAVARRSLEGAGLNSGQATAVATGQTHLIFERQTRKGV